MGEIVSIRLLGPVEVVVAGRSQAVNGLRRKAVLATLALHPGRAVSTSRLIDVVWGDLPPATAVNNLQRHVSYLRQLLQPPAEIVARPPGYVLNTGGEPTDVQTAERLLLQARQCADATERAARLRSALALWRGQPLADVVELPWLRKQAEHLTRLRHETERTLIDTRLALGEHAQLVPDLEELARQRPLDEQVHGQLMLALYRSGRQDEALATFRRLRDTLVEKLGIDPGPRLRELETAILRQDPAIEPSSVQTPQLPPVVPALSGRRAELAQLNELVDATREPGSTAVVAVLSGTAGVGKTTLAVHWARRVAPQFPDGQLYVNLRGFDPAVAVKDTAEALRDLLKALGMPAQGLPVGLDALASQYQRMLAGKRTLVVLDNARDADQVRPLLPHSSGCLALVTSRDQLFPLVVTEGARPLVLDLLDADDARDLLARRLGIQRVAAEPDSVEEIIARCARLPLALAIVAARAALRPNFSLAAIASQIRDAGLFDAFYGGDATTDVRAVFSWSCRTVSARALRLFALLGLHPGPDIGAAAAASLAGVTERAAMPLLAELTRANLLTESTQGRYGLHDLLRAYAASLDIRPDPDRQAALHRVLDHYLHTAHAASVRLHPQFSHISLATPHPGSNPRPMSDRAEATAWFNAEHAVLLAAIPYAAENGFEAHAWRLAWACSSYLSPRGYWPDHLAMQRIALAAATRAGDPVGQAHAHRELGWACCLLGRHDEAEHHLRSALDLFATHDEYAGQAHALHNLGQSAERQGDHRLALSHCEQALALFRQAGACAGEAYLLNSIGWHHAQLGDYEPALASCTEALKLLAEVDDVQGQADTWDSLGYIHHHLGDHRRAITCYKLALELFDEVGDRFGEACTRVNLGHSYRACSDVEAARTSWSRALTILDEFGAPVAGEVRADLERLGAPAAF